MEAPSPTWSVNRIFKTLSAFNVYFLIRCILRNFIIEAITVFEINFRAISRSNDAEKKKFIWISFYIYHLANFYHVYRDRFCDIFLPLLYPSAWGEKGKISKNTPYLWIILITNTWKILIAKVITANFSNFQKGRRER